MNIEQERDKVRRNIERGLDDPIYREELGRKLGLTLARHDDLKDQPIVAMLVPSYKSLAPNMLNDRSRLLAYSKQFCTVIQEPIKGSSVVHWVRNDMISPLYKNKKQFTHVLFIDDDMTFEPDTLVKLLRHDKDVIGISYVTRTDPPMPNAHIVTLEDHGGTRILSWNQPGVTREGESLICAANPGETLSCGTGMLLIKKEVLDRVGQYYVDCEYEQKMWGLTGDRLGEIQAIRKRACEFTGNYYWFKFLDRLCGFGESGEDVSFCIKSAMCGFKVYLDTAIELGHIGEYAYSYTDFLPYQKEEIMKAIEEKRNAKKQQWEEIKAQIADRETVHAH